MRETTNGREAIVTRPQLLAALKIRCPQGRVGSSPSSGIANSTGKNGVRDRAAPRGHLLKGSTVSRLWNKSARAGCEDCRPWKPSAFPPVGQVDKGHGGLCPRAVRRSGFFQPLTRSFCHASPADSSPPFPLPAPLPSRARARGWRWSFRRCGPRKRRGSFRSSRAASAPSTGRASAWQPNARRRPAAGRGPTMVDSASFPLPSSPWPLRNSDTKADRRFSSTSHNRRGLISF